MKLGVEKVGLNAVCKHCGDECLEDTVVYNEFSFCCTGCRSVYKILKENNLDAFYNIDQEAGMTQKGLVDKDFTFLDDPDIFERMISNIHNNYVTVWLNLPSIHCSSCIWLLENLSRLNQGIIRSTVNFLEKKALIQFDQDLISLKELANLLTKIGYPPQISLQDLDVNQQVKDNTLIYKLGIAGFVFGNIMLLSFPEYFGLRELDMRFSSYIHIINMVLILPVVFYCANDYFKSALAGIRAKKLNIDVPIVVGLLALLIKSISDIVFEISPGYFDSIAGLIFFLLIGRWFQNVTFERIHFDLNYKSYFPIAAGILKDRIESKIPLNKIRVGDHLRIRNGEIIPADGTLYSNSNAIDYSFVTGESEAVIKQKGDRIFSGGRVIGEMAEVLVTKTVETSYLTQLWNNNSKKSGKQNVSYINELVSKYFTYIILLISIIAFVYHYHFHSLSEAIHVFISILIVACPCALALAIPFTFGNLIRGLAKKKIFFKNTRIIEQCANIDYLVFDKTGTLTNNRSKQFEYIGDPLSFNQKVKIGSLARHSNHKVSREISTYFGDHEIQTIEGFIEEQGRGIQGIVNGSIVKIGSDQFLGLTRAGQFNQIFQLSSMSVYIEIDGDIVGGFKKESDFIEGLSNTLAKLGQRFKIALLSGDNDLDKYKLERVYDSWDHMLFGQSPFNKLEFIQMLKDSRKNVAMIGDGLNDAGALEISDLGIAVTQSENNFTPACDIIMDRSHLIDLYELFRVCRKSISIIYISYIAAFIYNIVGLYFAVQGILSPVIAAILMPVSSITIVVFGYLGSSILIKSSRL